MALLGPLQLSLLVGATLPRPAPYSLLRALEKATVTHSATGRSGFQLVFKAGRGRPYRREDYPLVRNPLLQMASRIILIVTLKGRPKVLMDGILTHQQLKPTVNPGEGLLTVTGEDVSLMMDLEEKIVEHRGQNDQMIAYKIIAAYAQYGLTPQVTPPAVLDPPLPTRRIPIQRGTDYEYLQEIARRYGYDFYLIPGPLPMTNRACWGPPKLVGAPQAPLTTNMGPANNIISLDFELDGLAPQETRANLEDGQAVEADHSSRQPLSRRPASKSKLLRQALLESTGRLDAAALRARVQARTDESLDRAVSATGSLDVLRYGALLQARRTVQVRGAGNTNNGLYYVNQVTHEIDLDQGSYRQKFRLSREGAGVLAPTATF